MNIREKMIRVGYWDVPAQLLEYLNDKEQWENERNNYFGLEQTTSIPLKYNFTYPEGMIGIRHRHNDKIYELIKPVIEETGKKLGEYYCSRALIAKLPPGGKVGDHVDPGLTFSLFHRYAWVIKTNPGAEMIIDGERRHFSTGEIWEINNKCTHGAVNEGQSDRLHLIFDIASLHTLIGLTPEPFPADSYDDKFFRIVLRKKQKTGKYEV